MFSLKNIQKRVCSSRREERRQETQCSGTRTRLAPTPLLGRNHWEQCLCSLPSVPKLRGPWGPSSAWQELCPGTSVCSEHLPLVWGLLLALSPETTVGVGDWCYLGKTGMISASFPTSQCPWFARVAAPPTPDTQKCLHLCSSAQPPVGKCAHLKHNPSDLFSDMHLRRS